MFERLIRPLPMLVLAMLLVPIAGGLIGALLPAFGWLPALGRDTFSLQAWHDLAAHPGIGDMVWLSLHTGLVSSGISLLLTLLLLASMLDTPWLARVQKLLSPLLSVPHAAAAIGVAFLFAPSGLLVRMLSPWLSGWQQPPDWLFPSDEYGLSMVLGLVIKEVPFLLLMSLAALNHCNAVTQHRLARTLGYSPVTAFFKVVLPVLYPLLRLPMMAVIVFATASVEVALILGPSTPAPLAAMVVRWFSDPDLAMRFQASAGALLQFGVSGAALAVWFLLERMVAFVSRSWVVNGGRTYADATVSRLGKGVSMLWVGVMLLGLAGLVVWSLAGFWRFPDALPSTFMLRHWLRGLPAVADAMWQAVMIAGLSTAVAVVLTLLMLEAYSQRQRQLSNMASVVLYLPMIVPAVAFLFGIVWLQEQLGIQAGFWPVVCVHILFVLPYVYLSLVASYRTLDPRWAFVAKSLGASPWRVFLHVRVPLLTVPIFTAAAVGLAVSLGQYLPTLLVGGGRVNTITLEAVSIATGGERRLMAVYALTQMLLPMLGFLLALYLPKWLLRGRRGVVLGHE